MYDFFRRMTSLWNMASMVLGFQAKIAQLPFHLLTTEQIIQGKFYNNKNNRIPLSLKLGHHNNADNVDKTIHFQGVRELNGHVCQGSPMYLMLRGTQQMLVRSPHRTLLQHVLVRIWILSLGMGKHPKHFLRKDINCRLPENCPLIIHIAICTIPLRIHFCLLKQKCYFR